MSREIDVMMGAVGKASQKQEQLSWVLKIWTCPKEG
jgi:hypothetical protein